MASRRSRRAQSGSGGVQEQLASLAGIQQLMGDPLKDLAGLMQLQQMSEASAQGPRDEARSMRNEEFAREQAGLREANVDKDRRQRFGIAHAQWKLQDAANQLSQAGNEQQRKQAALNYDLEKEKFAALTAHQEWTQDQPMHPEMADLLKVLSLADLIPGDNNDLGTQIGGRLRELLNLSEEDVPEVPTGDVKEKLNRPLNKVRREAPPVMDWMTGS